MKQFSMRSFTFISLALVGLIHSSAPAAGQQFEAQQLLPSFGKDCVGCKSGSTVEVSGDWAFVGVWTKGLLVYHRTPAGWVFHQLIRAVPGSAYPASISAAGSTLVVGAWWSESPSGVKVGKAHVYELIGDMWMQTQELQPPNLQENDVFGASLSLFGNVLAVGAPAVEVTLASGEVIEEAGAVFIYQRTSPGEPWELEDRLLSPAAFQVGGVWGVSAMGISVAVGEDVVAAGAPNHVGAVFVFERDSNGWHRTQMLQDPTQDQSDRFGEALAMSGNTLVIGESSKAHAGRAFVFEKDTQASGKWGLTQELRASDGWFAASDNDEFGFSLDIEGDHIVIGAHNGNFHGVGAGTAYLFCRDASGGWPVTETQRLVRSVVGGSESLGFSIAFDGTTIMVGAPGTRSGDLRPGSAFVFELELGKQFCLPTQNSLGLLGRLALIGSELADDEDLTLSVSRCTPGSIGFFLMAPGGNPGLNIPLGEGRLCLGPGGVTRLRPALSTGPLGILTHSLDSRADVIYPPAGSTWSFQFLYRDPAGGPSGINLTNAVELTLQ